jgi:hypothetical protein
MKRSTTPDIETFRPMLQEPVDPQKSSPLRGSTERKSILKNN